MVIVPQLTRQIVAYVMRSGLIRKKSNKRM